MAKKETASDDIKAGLVRFVEGSLLKDWKRVSKTKVTAGGGHNIKRVFMNGPLGVEVVVYGDEDDDVGAYTETGKMLFYAEDLTPDACEDYDVEGGCMVMFAAETFWNRNHYIPDNHISFVIADHYGVDMSDFDEMSENQFLVDSPASEVIATLEAHGMRHEPEMKRAGQWEETGVEASDGSPKYSTELDPVHDTFPHPEYAKQYDADLGEFTTLFTREQARANIKDMMLSNEDEEEREPEEYALALDVVVAKLNDYQLQETLCSSGIIHDTSFGGLLDTPEEAEAKRVAAELRATELAASREAARLRREEDEARTVARRERVMTTDMVVAYLPERFPDSGLWYFVRIEKPHRISKLLDGDVEVAFVFATNVEGQDAPRTVAVYSPDGGPDSVYVWEFEDDITPPTGMVPVSVRPTKPAAPAPAPVAPVNHSWVVTRMPSSQPAYEAGPPVTDESIEAALHDEFDHWNVTTSGWTMTKTDKKDLKVIRFYDGLMHYDGNTDVSEPIRAVVISSNENDSNNLDVKEYDDTVLFGFHDPADTDGAVVVWFSNKSYWEREKSFTDQHQETELKLLHGLPDCYDEAMENWFEDGQGRDRDQVKAELEGLGFVYSDEVFSD